MYEQYFGFNRTPFRLESEPDMFFFGESQKNVLECIKHSLLLRKGIITLSGLPGSGKTTVMRRAIEESIVPDTIICRINRARCTNFLEALKTEIQARQKNKDNEDAQASELHLLVAKAVEDKKHFLVVVDESQQLTESEVDELFTLVSIEKDSRKHFKFLLVSHEPFHEYFDIDKYANSDELVSTHCFLLPLLHEEILPYIEHRLSNAGWKGTPTFSSEIERTVFLITQGIPRRINSFFDRLMLFSYFESTNLIDDDFVKRFCLDLLSELDAQPHPDLDSFDLRQALRRERRVFAPELIVDPVVIEDEESLLNAGNEDKNGVDPENSAIGFYTSKTKEPLASENPEELILFVASFIKNPERYKNYTDQYYKIPKNLTLLLCLATETDLYIDDITPAALSSYSATDIKLMIAVFIEKMLITSRFDPYRVLGLDSTTNEEEVNRHFSYMMRLCRSNYVKSDRSEFERIIKEAYIKLLSLNKPVIDEIPVVDDVLISVNDAPVYDVELPVFDGDAEKKVAELEKAKSMISTVPAVSPKIEPLPISDESPSNPVFENKKSFVLPLTLGGLAVAMGLGYLFLGGAVQNPESQNNLLQPVKTVESISAPEREQEQGVEYTQILLLNPGKEKKVAEPKIAGDKQNVTLVTAGKIDLSEEIKHEKVIKSKVLPTTLEKKVEVVKKHIKQVPDESAVTFKPKVSENLNGKLNEELNEELNGDGDLFLERRQLDRVINNFKYTYENSNVDELATLFVENAITNEGFTREQIIEDYEFLFEKSDTRTIHFTDVSWKFDGDIAIGSGQFSTSITNYEDDTTELKKGRISIKVVDADETKKITELFFLYQFAEAD